MLRSEFKPLGPGTGVDKLSSGCCLVSMGELSYMALFFFSIRFAIRPCYSLQSWVADALSKKCALFVRVRWVCSNNPTQGNLLLTSPAVVNLARQLCAHICQKKLLCSWRDINAPVDFFVDKWLACRLHLVLLCFCVVAAGFDLKTRFVNQQLRSASLSLAFR